jgi:urease accessory protein
MLDRPAKPSPSFSRADLAALPRHVRANAGVRLAFRTVGGLTRRAVAEEWGGYRARFPTTFRPEAEAVLINTGGGMTGGDSYRADITLDAGADAVLTTQAAEKIYRSDGPDTLVETRLTLGDGARLDWLPQEAILFEGARLKRELTIEMAADARLIACESLFFGRAAMGETLDDAHWRERWRVRRGGRLIFAEDVRLEGSFRATLRRKAVADGARAVATVLCVAPDAPERLESLRDAMAASASEWGASCLDGFVVLRLLAPDAAQLRGDLARALVFLTGRALPRSWQT